MVPDWLITYVGGGILVVVSYMIISNTFWLLFGSSVLTKLPGVNQTGAKGSLKIALLIILTVIGFFYWFIGLPFRLFFDKKKNKTLKIYISKSIQTASKWHGKIINSQDNHED